MSDFRKLLLAFAAVTLLAGIASAADHAPPLVCSTTAQPLSVRAETVAQPTNVAIGCNYANTDAFVPVLLLQSVTTSTNPFFSPAEGKTVLIVLIRARMVWPVQAIAPPLTIDRTEYHATVSAGFFNTGTTLTPLNSNFADESTFKAYPTNWTTLAKNTLNGSTRAANNNRNVIRVVVDVGLGKTAVSVDNTLNTGNSAAGAFISAHNSAQAARVPFVTTTATLNTGAHVVATVNVSATALNHVIASSPVARTGPITAAGNAFFGAMNRAALSASGS